MSFRKRPFLLEIHLSCIYQKKGMVLYMENGNCLTDIIDYFFEMIDVFEKHITVKYLIKKICILILCVVHEFTKYKTCHNFYDLFYWPDGFCADTIVIITFFTIGAWTLWDDWKIFDDMCLKGDHDEH